jgi:hypothetical protein
MKSENLKALKVHLQQEVKTVSVGMTTYLHHKVLFNET